MHRPEGVVPEQKGTEDVGLSVRGAHELDGGHHPDLVHLAHEGDVREGDEPRGDDTEDVRVEPHARAPRAGHDKDTSTHKKTRGAVGADEGSEQHVARVGGKVLLEPRRRGVRVRGRSFQALGHGAVELWLREREGLFLLGLPSLVVFNFLPLLGHSCVHHGTQDRRPRARHPRALRVR